MKCSLEQLHAAVIRESDRQHLAGLIEKRKKEELIEKKKKEDRLWLNMGLFEKRLEVAKRQQEEFSTTA